MLSKIWVWYPRSGIHNPGSGKTIFRIQGSKRYRATSPESCSGPSSGSWSSPGSETLPTPLPDPSTGRLLRSKLPAIPHYCKVIKKLHCILLFFLLKNKRKNSVKTDIFLKYNINSMKIKKFKKFKLILPIFDTMHSSKNILTQLTLASSQKKFFSCSQSSSFQIPCCGSGMFIPDPKFFPSRVRFFFASRIPIQRNERI